MEQDLASGRKQVTVGLVAKAAAEFLQLNAVASGDLAVDLLRLRVGDLVEIAGPITLKARVDDHGTPSATFDINVRRVRKPQLNRNNEEALAALENA